MPVLQFKKYISQIATLKTSFLYAVNYCACSFNVNLS